MKQRIVERGLTNKGFEQHDSRHRHFVYVSTSGKKTLVKTFTSHGPDQTLSAELVSKMSRQCKLAVSDFEELVYCPLKQADYENKLRIQDISLD